MDVPNKLTFISELIDNIKLDILEKVKDMPEEWDIIELRWYMAEKFKEEMIEPSVYNTRSEHKKRYREYRYAVFAKGL